MKRERCCKDVSTIKTGELYYFLSWPMTVLKEVVQVPPVVVNHCFYYYFFSLFYSFYLFIYLFIYSVFLIAM